MTATTRTDEMYEPIFDNHTGQTYAPFELSRRCFVQLIGAGLLITIIEGPAAAQRGDDRSRQSVAARVQLNTDGSISVMTGKVEEGQGARTQITQAAAEELHVRADRIRLIMADTELVPDDGITAGSRTTPYTIPAVRQGAAAARELLRRYAAGQWNVKPDALTIRDGIITGPEANQKMEYADLARAPELADTFRRPADFDVDLVSVADWQVMGESVPRPNARDLVTGRHRYPSDIVRPGMYYGKILRAPSFGATLESVDFSAAEQMKDVVVLREGQFVGCAAPNSFTAAAAVDAVAKTAKWKTISHVSDKDLFAHLKKNAQTGSRSRPQTRGSVNKAIAAARNVLTASYEVAYVQHAPLEPRAAVAEWQNGKLTVWAGVDWPQRAQRDLAGAFGMPTERVRVIVPDMGGGFGGKHTCEAAMEAARLAKAAGRPVAVHWTREEEFTWAYCRPAALIECRGALDAAGTLTGWDFTSINPGGAGIDTPYNVPNSRILSAGSDSPLRQGSYRCLAATANNFAREAFMDELAAAAEADPLDFRLRHLGNDRIRAVLQLAAEKFDWVKTRKDRQPDHGVGLACGTEKNSVVAACVRIRVNRADGTLKILHICEAFECGPIQNPAGLLSQVQGCIMMGLGPALRERLRFADGKILNPRFSDYEVPRFADVPPIDIHLVNKTEMPSAGGGETPIIAIAPAIANAIFDAVGFRIRQMPMLEALARQLKEA
ncbi:MAG TPA: molybdopterin-dependent oxidoreductase [Anaerohalosphaeraceae bacterium]|nr:molybdopterin-dependent oxidoreductase [Anaerohalosphaeraceae bacterium]HRT85431.1 molybdopterin-dependent oxidoreductase [Anaerohalosphaeraceae bacterium]